MPDHNDLDHATCTNCHKTSSFPKGTLTAQGKANFRCSGCSTSTVETNVETSKHAGKQLLTEG